MALVQAIEFRNLAAQLNAQEKGSFISKLALSHSQLIIESLYSRFVCQSPNDLGESHNAHCNEIISEIIQSRDSDDTDEDNLQLDTLPRSLIGLCASYLEQNSYVSLSVSNRSIFLGCNTPNMLKEIYVEYNRLCDHLSLNFCTFSFVHKLSLCIDEDLGANNPRGVFTTERIPVIASQIAKMPRLQSMVLYNTVARFIEIIANDETTNQRITSLSMDVDDQPTLDQILFSTTAFERLQYLKLYLAESAISTDSAGKSEIESFVEICRNLRGLDFYDGGCGIQLPILQAIGYQLRFLKMHPLGNEEMVAMRKIDFTNLRQLQQAKRDDPPILVILKSAVNLEKVKLKPAFLELMGHVFTKCERLKYFEVDLLDMERALEWLELCLFRTKKLQRDAIKIRIDTNVTSKKSIFMKLDRIVNALYTNPVDQWMLILNLEPMGEKKKKSFVGDLRQILTAGTCIEVISTAEISHRRHVIVITNPGCTIIGWRESWIMDFSSLIEPAVSLAAQLTSSETISFIKKAAESNPQMILDALSSYFIHRLPINDNINHNDQCIESISNIIQSRDSQSERQILSKLDALPTSAIGACASFLDQKSYGRLSCVNRAVYLGCNSPNTLRNLLVHYRSSTDHQSLNVSKFPFTNWLKVNAAK